MNMQNLMMQARKMQKDVEKIKEDIENTHFEGKSSLATVVVKGDYEVQKIDINEDIVGDKETIEDMVLLAINDAVKNIASTKEDKLGNVANGLGDLF